MSDPNAQPIAGWYTDPENEAGDRWWNGASWSDQRRARNSGGGWAPVDAAAPPPAIPVPPVAPAPAERPNPYAGSTPTASYPGAGPDGQLYAPYAYAVAPRTPTANVPAVAGMIVSLCALLFNFFIFGLPGLVGGCISIYGLVKANRLAKSGMTTGNGRVFAIVGIIAGFAGAILFNVFYFGYQALVYSPYSY